MAFDLGTQQVAILATAAIFGALGGLADDITQIVRGSDQTGEALGFGRNRLRMPHRVRGDLALGFIGPLFVGAIVGVLAASIFLLLTPATTAPAAFDVENLTQRLAAAGVPQATIDALDLEEPSAPTVELFQVVLWGLLGGITGAVALRVLRTRVVELLKIAALLGGRDALASAGKDVAEAVAAAAAPAGAADDIEATAAQAELRTTARQAAADAYERWSEASPFTI